MNIERYIVGLVTALLILVAGLIIMPFALGGRIPPGVVLGTQSVGGLDQADLERVLTPVEEDLLDEIVTVSIGTIQKSYSLRELGVRIQADQTKEVLQSVSKVTNWFQRPRVVPAITTDEKVAYKVLHGDLAPQLQLPRDATLSLGVGGGLSMVKSAPGEHIDVLALEQELNKTIRTESYSRPIPLKIISAPASIQDTEIAAAQGLATQLLAEGFEITFEDVTYNITPFTVRRLLVFTPQIDPVDSDNEVLGVQFDPVELETYLTTTVVPQVNQPAVNARFALAQETQEGQPPRVERFALPQRGQELNIPKTIELINQALVIGGRQSALAVTTTEPDIADSAAIHTVGVTTLLAQGVSDFVGSPVNRVHNIRVGAEKYHGLLISPGQEFSFNEYLGPVDASTGFKPELVIKTNVTVPEYGGGLCQVSTTAFRAAIQSGLEITERRNHSYAVSYYGTPGFDSTIYPGHTDLRFLNNTPGYILIQTRIEGTKLFFDFWGTDDGRTVEVDGPNPYNRQPDGAVKATLTQVVSRDGQTVIEDTFYSNYKSPNLFPKVLSANGEQPTPNVTTPTTPNSSTEDPNQGPKTPPKTSSTPSST